MNSIFSGVVNLVVLSRAANKMSEENSDEIRAWREERKRNYPTRLNVQRKVINNRSVRIYGEGDL